MGNALLIVFIKNEMLGFVKTRLAADIGNENALKVYQLLLQHTLMVTSPLQVDKAVFYSNYIPLSDKWQENHFIRRLQRGNDLGERMQNAFEEMFEKGYESIVIIGSDCKDLNTGHLLQSFSLLKKKEVVIGPANDGGYYLLGMKNLHAGIFMNKNWSNAALLNQTIETIEALKLSFALLPALSDVDEVKDLPAEWKHLGKK